MSLAREIVEDAAIGVGITDTLEGLSVVREPGCAAAICQRPRIAGFQAWLDMLPPEQLPHARVILRPAAVRNAVSKICEASGAPKGAEREYFADDVAALAGVFAKLMRAEWLRLRLDVVTSDACRRFHTDVVTARLICTYRGTGSQYGNASQGNIPQGNISQGNALRDNFPQGDIPDPIFTVPTGAPIVLRGKLWPEHPPSGLLHRSPPIAGTGETRLLLVLDPVAGPEEEI